MIPEEVEKLKANLEKRKADILGQLREVAHGNPVVKDDFEVTVKDLGNEAYDNAEEEAELDRDFPLVQQLEQELHEVETALAKLADGTYGS